jgi:hypothetical protein
MNLTKKIVQILAVVAISIGLLVASPRSAFAAVEKPENCTRWHTVQSGEYLAKIAAMYDTNWRDIAEINNLANPSLIFANNKLCIFYTGFTSSPPTQAPVSSSKANVFASSVKEDAFVTIQGKNLAASSRYTVYLGNYKVDPAGRFLAGTALTDKNGYFKGTFNIPKKLYDVAKIRVNIISPGGVTSSNWFFNTTSTGYTGGLGSPDVSLKVQSVKKGAWVKIAANNLPPHVSFKVYMTRPEANPKKAVLVGTILGTKSGSVVASFNIPDSLQDRSRLELRTVNVALEMDAEVLFDNKTTR